jgi:hypothetical protein
MLANSPAIGQLFGQALSREVRLTRSSDLLAMELADGSVRDRTLPASLLTVSIRPFGGLRCRGGQVCC